MPQLRTFERVLKFQWLSFAQLPIWFLSPPQDGKAKGVFAYHGSLRMVQFPVLPSMEKCGADQQLVP